MPELLLELFSEEIPARMQARAAEDLKRLVTEGLRENGLTFEKAQAFVTPRRLALVVDGLPDTQPDVREERRGPRVGAPSKAVEGFLKANGLTSVDQCEQRDTGKGVFWFVVSYRHGVESRALIPDIICDVLASFPWRKSMRWGMGVERGGALLLENGSRLLSENGNVIRSEDRPFRWVRPLHRIVCLFDGDPVPFEIDLVDRKVVAGDKTVGHRFHAPKPFKVKDFADYNAKLQAGHVEPDAGVRRARILEKAREIAKDEGLTLNEDAAGAVVEEVARMVEWPVVLAGSIDEAFLHLPPEVLTTVMERHQKYFSLRKPNGDLAPRFIVVADIEAEDGGKEIIAGNERVLRARLSDARFFWDQDRKQTLASRAPALKDIVFHAKLGSIDEKVDRMQALAVELAGVIEGADKDRVRSAARLCKADLTTEMVGEFPELQGVMGRYYALHDGESDEVAEAIAEHYAPQGPNDACPTAPVSVAVALADKIDTLTGFFAVGETPTGSKDPFALRRAALGAIRLILENEVSFDLRPVLDHARGLYGNSGTLKGDVSDRDWIDAREGLRAFFVDRLKVHLKERGLRHDLVEAVFAVSGEDDLLRLVRKADALKDFLATDDGADLLTAYRRANNIVRIEQRKDDKDYHGEVKDDLLVQDEERILWEKLAGVVNLPTRDMAQFAQVLGALATLREPVDAFFDEVTVNTDDPPLRENRLKLLSEIAMTLDKVADFSQIEG